MVDWEHNDYYKKLDAIFKLKIGPQIKGSGFLIDDFLRAENIVTGKTFFILMVNNYQLRFTDKKSLLVQMISICQKLHFEYKSEVKGLEHHKYHDLDFAPHNDSTLHEYYYKTDKIEKLHAKLTEKLKELHNDQQK